VHLGDPEPFGDLGLGHVLEESKQEHGSGRSGNAATGGRTVSTSSTLSRLASKSPKLLLTDRPSSSPCVSGPFVCSAFSATIKNKSARAGT
jgi:hypothetical protein